MENTSISDLILPTPFNQKTSHNFQLVHSKVNRFSISDLYHLSIWLPRAVSHHGHGLSPVVIYCEVVIVTVTKTANRLLYLCVLSSWPWECPSFEKCACILKTNLTPENVLLCDHFPVTLKYWNAFFYLLHDFCFWFLISVLHHGGLKFKLPWTEKSTVFPENSERDYTAPQLLFPQKPSSSLSRTHRSEAYPLC